MLLQVAEQALPQRVKRGLLSYCPTMDLVAVATEDEQVHVFRLNGQKVFTVLKRDAEAVVQAMCWKPNGRVLLVAYAGGVTSLISTYTGKIINHFFSASIADSSVSCVGWGLNFTDPVAVRSLLESGKTQPGAGVAAKKAMQRGNLLEEALHKGLRALEIEVPLDLPADLRNLDIEPSLPKLSILPSSGSNDDAFTSRASIDTIFHTAKKDSNESADVIVVGAEDGTLHLSIYDFFGLGSFNNLKQDGHGRVARHCSHPYSPTHGLLLAGDAKSSALSFVPLDLKVIPDTGTYLPLLASKSGQVQNIVRYMKSSIAQICADFKVSQELPRRFMRNAEEDLQEKEQTSFVNTIYHFAATGHCSPVLKDWLVDQLGERGHKRWEKAAASGYEGVCRYTLQNLIPALDRFMILISRLRGLSRFFESSAALGLSTVALDLVLDTASCLKFMAHIVLIAASKELKGYTAFGTWMKLEIEVQDTEPTSATAEDFPAKYAALDYPSIFEYIQDGLQRSSLSDLCEPSSEASSGERLLSQSGSIYEDFKKLIKSELKDKPRPSLGAVLKRLEQQCQGIFSDIAAALRRKVRFGEFVNIEHKSVACFDMFMIVDKKVADDNACSAIVAAALKDEPRINVQKINMTIMNGISEVESIDKAHFKLPAKRAVADLKFIDQDTLVIVLKGSGVDPPCLVYLPIQEQSKDPSGIEYARFALKDMSAAPGPVMDVASEALMEKHIVHLFDERPPWDPVEVEVHRRKGRRALCVLASDQLRYRVFGLEPSGEEEGEEEDDEMDAVHG